VKLTLPGGPATKIPGTSKDVPPPQPPAHEIFITTESAEVGQTAPHCSKLIGTVSQHPKQRSTPSHPQLMIDLQVVALAQVVVQVAQVVEPSPPWQRVALGFSLLWQHKLHKPFYFSSRYLRSPARSRIAMTIKANPNQLKRPTPNPIRSARTTAQYAHSPITNKSRILTRGASKLYRNLFSQNSWSLTKRFFICEFYPI
jgi:hypothetical protein